MRIAVCVKEVPGASSARRLDPGTKRLVREGDMVLNSFDGHAVEAALQVKEALGADVTVTAYCMGPAGATRTLQKALALGADEAVLVTDEALAGSDILATARALAAAISKDGYDLVVMGQQAGDSDCWALPGALAEVLGVPVATQASKLEVTASGASLERQTELGYEKLSVDLPAVVSVSDALNTPRYPSLKAIMGAKKKPQATYGLAELGVDAGSVGAAGSGTVVLELSPPPAKEAGLKVEDDGSGLGAEKILEFLAQRNLV